MLLQSLLASELQFTQPQQRLKKCVQTILGAGWHKSVLKFVAVAPDKEHRPWVEVFRD